MAKYTCYICQRQGLHRNLVAVFESTSHALCNKCADNGQTLPTRHRTDTVTCRYCNRKWARAQVEEDGRCPNCQNVQDTWKSAQQRRRELRKKVLQQQDYKCAICQKTISFRKSHFDHDYKTGYIRGLLCPGCNHGLGCLGDTIEGLEVAIAYLKDPPLGGEKIRYN